MLFTLGTLTFTPAPAGAQDAELPLRATLTPVYKPGILGGTLKRPDPFRGGDPHFNVAREEWKETQSSGLYNFGPFIFLGKGVGSKEQAFKDTRADFSLGRLLEGGTHFEADFTFEHKMFSRITTDGSTTLKFKTVLKIKSCDGDSPEVAMGDSVEKIMGILENPQLDLSEERTCELEIMAVFPQNAFQQNLPIFSHLLGDDTIGALVPIHKIAGARYSLVLTAGERLVLNCDTPLVRGKPGENEIIRDGARTQDFYNNFAGVDRSNLSTVFTAPAPLRLTPAQTATLEAAQQYLSILSEYRREVRLASGLEAASRASFLAAFFEDHPVRVTALQRAYWNYRQGFAGLPTQYRISATRSVSRAYEQLRIIETKVVRTPILNRYLESRLEKVPLTSAPSAD